MTNSSCFNVRIRLTSHKLEEIYACIRLLAEKLCTEMECSYPDTLSWILAGTAKCLVEISTPQPLQTLSTSNLLPALIASSIEIFCNEAEEVISMSKYILQVLSECKGIGTTLVP